MNKTRTSKKILATFARNHMKNTNLNFYNQQIVRLEIDKIKLQLQSSNAQLEKETNDSFIKSILRKNEKLNMQRIALENVLEVQNGL